MSTRYQCEGREIGRGVSRRRRKESKVNRLPQLGGIAGTKAISLAHLAVAFMFTVTMHTITLADEPFRSLEQEVVAMNSHHPPHFGIGQSGIQQATRSFNENCTHQIDHYLRQLRAG